MLMKTHRNLWIVLCFVLCGAIPSCYSADLYVPGDYPAIQDAIDAAVPGDSVLVADGTWSGSGNVNLHPDGKNLTIRSASGDPELCIIDGEGTGQGFICSSNETRDTVIKGFTMYRCGRDPNLGPVTGAGIYCKSASPTITLCRFVDGDAAWSYSGPGSGSYGSGGGIACIEGGAPDISECEFVNCVAGESGGALYVDTANPVISGCTFTNNRTFANGGAIFLQNGTAEIHACVFTDNRANNGDGGAIYLKTSNSQIARCTFLQNRSLRGGAIACPESTPVIGGSTDDVNTFDGNVAGAGADLFALMQPSVINATFNTFAGLAMSDYSVVPQNAFDLTGSVSLAIPIQTDVYVAQNGTNSNDGLTFDTPFRTIQYALSRILPTEANPITVHIASGDYSTSTTAEQFPLPLLDHLTLSGAGQFRTYLSPEYGTVCLFGFRDSDVRVCDLDIHGGSGQSGGGLYADECQLELTNLTVRESVANDGGAMYLLGSSARLFGIRITDNYSRYMGIAAGICSLQGQLSLFDCVVARNASDGPGAGLYAQGETLLVDCLIEDNESRRGGAGAGVCSSQGSLQMVNCQVRGNKTMYGVGVSVTGTFDLLNCIVTGNTGSLSGAGIQSRDSTGVIRHCTFADNVSSSQPISTLAFTNSTVTITDSIMWNDIGDEIEIDNATVVVSHSAVQGGFAGLGNISVDPVFTSGVLSDYYLGDGSSGGPVSPCIDAGSDLAVNFVYSSDWGDLNLSHWTAASGWTEDIGLVDMGCHWDFPLYSGVRLDLTDDMLLPGDLLRLDAVVINNSDTDWHDSHLFVILDILSSYWFAPSWIYMNDGFDSYPLDIVVGDRQRIGIIPEIIWPETSGDASNLLFWGGLTDEGITSLIGEIDQVVFSYRSR